MITEISVKGVIRMTEEKKDVGVVLDGGGEKKNAPWKKENDKAAGARSVSPLLTPFMDEILSDQPAEPEASPSCETDAEGSPAVALSLKTAEEDTELTVGEARGAETAPIAAGDAALWSGNSADAAASDAAAWNAATWNGNTVDAAELPQTTSRAPRRRRMIIALAAVLLATISVMIYGILVKDVFSRAVRNMDSLPMLMLGEVFGRGITRYSGSGGAASLQRIPLPKVPDGEKPGAAELEQIPDIDEPEPVTGGEVLTLREVDLSVGENGIFTLINETSYDPDVLSLLTAQFPIPSADSLTAEYGEGAPLVLILHTHGSESFSPEGATEVAADESFRSNDPKESVVSVGRVFAETLRGNGIETIHIETMFDVEDYNSAYAKSAAAVREYLAKYPSIRYVFDIHRDALITESGDNLKPVAEGGAAQVMVVVGTNHGGANHPNWENNLTVALRLQEAAGTTTPTLVRGINLRSPSFNGQYAPGSLLLEIGAAGNSLTEAKAAARLMGEAAAKIIKEGGEG